MFKRETVTGSNQLGMAYYLVKIKVDDPYKKSYSACPVLRGVCQ